MSKQRQRAREARQAQRRAEVAEAARKRERHERRQALRDRMTPTVRRRPRRYGALSTRARYQVAAVFLAVQAVVWFFVDEPRQRFSAAVLTAALLAVAVRTRRSTTR